MWSLLIFGQTHVCLSGIWEGLSLRMHTKEEEDICHDEIE
jgi:hypothetical protein